MRPFTAIVVIGLLVLIIGAFGAEFELTPKEEGMGGALARAEGQPPTGVSDVDAVYRLMGVTHAYFKSRFGRDGIDGKGSRSSA